MSCCGRARSAARGPSAAAIPLTRRRPGGPPASAGIVFEYLGTTGLTAVGPVTRRTYVFDAPGARLAIDPRDAASARAIPQLRQVPLDEVR